ncbi:hypothetical protein BJX70DRAFT_188071 [Aspergillus crustosus]
MPLFRAIERVSDMIISAINRSSSPHAPQYNESSTSSLPRQTHHLTRDRPRHEEGPSDRYPRAVPPAYEHAVTPGRAVRWGTITEISETQRSKSKSRSKSNSGSTNPDQHPYSQDRSRNASGNPNYIYGADDTYHYTHSSPRTSLQSSPSGSRSSSPDDRTNTAYGDQRYPQWATSSRFRSKSDPQSPRHRTHYPRKTILKSPTGTDQEMLIRNLWSMAVLADHRLNYTYEFLSGILLMGEDMLDTIYQAGEFSMFEDAIRAATGRGEGARARALQEKVQNGLELNVEAQRQMQAQRYAQAQATRPLNLQRPVRRDVSGYMRDEGMVREGGPSRGVRREEVILEED